MSVRETDPTVDEQRFFSALSARVPELEDWYHADDDGTPWMIASYDFVVGTAVRKTLRVDYDGRTLCGGWSPACLNWDDGVRAEEALIETRAPDGLHLDVVDPDEAAQAAAAWFDGHVSRLNAANNPSAT